MAKVRQLAIFNSTIDSTPIGATTPSTGAFTGLTGNINMPAETPQIGPSAAIVGTGGDAALFTFPALNAGRVQASKGIRITFATQHTVGTAAVTYKLKFGATVVDTFSVTPFNTTFIDVEVYNFFNNSAVQNAQNWLRAGILNTSTVASSQPATASAGAATIDMTASQVVSFTFNVASTDQVKPVFAMIELIQ